MNQKKYLLNVIKSFTEPKDEYIRISRTQYNNEISEAEKRMNEGRYLSEDKKINPTI